MSSLWLQKHNQKYNEKPFKKHIESINRIGEWNILMSRLWLQSHTANKSSFKKCSAEVGGQDEEELLSPASADIYLIVTGSQISMIVEFVIFLLKVKRPQEDTIP